MHGRAIAALSAFSMCSAALDEVIEYSKREQFGKKSGIFNKFKKSFLIQGSLLKLVCQCLTNLLNLRGIIILTQKISVQ